MILETERLHLRPINRGDDHDIAENIFNDPSVAGLLAHDIRDPASALKEAVRWTKSMGDDVENSMWERGGIGLFTIQDRASMGFVGVCGFYMEQDGAGIWSGEYFYALASSWHGQGIMSECAGLMREQIERLDNLGSLYAVYWDGINEASGRILRKTGFQDAGRKLLLEEYSEEKCRNILEYDLWRIAQAAGTKAADEVAVQATRRIGAFVAEGLATEENARGRMIEAGGKNCLSSAAEEMFAWSQANPGYALLTFTRQ